MQDPRGGPPHNMAAQGPHKDKSGPGERQTERKRETERETERHRERERETERDRERGPRERDREPDPAWSPIVQCLLVDTGS
jgi:hypothetical protein